MSPQFSIAIRSHPRQLRPPNRAIIIDRHGQNALPQLQIRHFSPRHFSSYQLSSPTFASGLRSHNLIFCVACTSYENKIDITRQSAIVSDPETHSASRSIHVYGPYRFKGVFPLFYSAFLFFYICIFLPNPFAGGLAGPDILPKRPCKRQHINQWRQSHIRRNTSKRRKSRSPVHL